MNLLTRAWRTISEESGSIFGQAIGAVLGAMIGSQIHGAIKQRRALNAVEINTENETVSWSDRVFMPYIIEAIKKLLSTENWQEAANTILIQLSSLGAYYEAMSLDLNFSEEQRTAAKQRLEIISSGLNVVIGFIKNQFKDFTTHKVKVNPVELEQFNSQVLSWNILEAKELEATATQIATKQKSKFSIKHIGYLLAAYVMLRKIIKK